MERNDVCWHEKVEKREVKRTKKASPAKGGGAVTDPSRRGKTSLRKRMGSPVLYSK